MRNRLKNYHKYLLGNQGDFIIEKVIFHGIAIIIFVYLLAMSAFNLMYEQYFLATLLFAMCFILAFFYYYSRFLGHYRTSYLLFGVVCYLVIAINFYFNDGIQGPSAYVFLMFHMVMMVLSSRKHYVFWIVYNSVIITLLLYFGIFHGESIPTFYIDREHQFWDHLITYIVSVLGIFSIVVTLKRLNRKQKEETEKKGVELLEVNHMLQNSNEQKNKVIALISHDIRSPLNSIVSILEFEQAGDLDEKELELVRRELLTITTHTTKMLDNILEWASFEMQEKDLNITRSDIKSACESVLAVFAILASHKEISLKTEFKDNPVVTTDMGKVILIVRNLVQNAIKFTPAGGEIAFSVEKIGEKVEISISDSGIGLSEEKLKSLFRLDIQATYGTDREKGTGLGLYLSKENARKIGADISVTSEEGKGATFILTLPLSIGDGDQQAASEPKR